MPNTSPRRHVERDVLEDRVAVVADGQVLDVDERFARLAHMSST